MSNARQISAKLSSLRTQIKEVEEHLYTDLGRIEYSGGSPTPITQLVSQLLDIQGRLEALRASIDVAYKQSQPKE